MIIINKLMIFHIWSLITGRLYSISPPLSATVGKNSAGRDHACACTCACPLHLPPTAYLPYPLPPSACPWSSTICPHFPSSPCFCACLCATCPPPPLPSTPLPPPLTFCAALGPVLAPVCRQWAVVALALALAQPTRQKQWWQPPGPAEPEVSSGEGQAGWSSLHSPPSFTLWVSRTSPTPWTSCCAPRPHKPSGFKAGGSSALASSPCPVLGPEQWLAPGQYLNLRQGSSPHCPLLVDGGGEGNIVDLSKYSTFPKVEKSVIMRNQT